MSDNAHLLGRLALLQRDASPVARAIGAALTAASLDALDDDERNWVTRIADLRAEVDASTEQINTALVNTRGVVKPMELGDVCRRRSKKEPWGIFLLTLARTLAPQRSIELGTCLGISAAYLGAGLQLAGAGSLASIEGAPALAERASRHLEQLDLSVDVRAGLFTQTLDPLLEEGGAVDLAFIDGHHQEEPTLAYFDQIARHLTEGAVVVFDDIRWSEGMEKAWARLCEDPRMEVVIDLDRVGLCVVRPGGAPRPARVYELPTLSSLRTRLTSARPSATPYDLLPAEGVARLNWGCGERGAEGWINADLKAHPSIQITGDIRDGLPLPDACLDYIVSIHALPMISLPEIPGVLAELRRTLKPGGTLRLSLPNLDNGIAAYQRGDRGYFLVSDHDAATLSGKLITQILWFGYTVTLFTPEFAEELLLQAGFTNIEHCAIGQTASNHAEITELDNREGESFFIEASP